MKNSEKTGAKKFDGGKARISLIPRSFLNGTAKALMFGAEVKYSDHNWRKGLVWSRLFDATERHLGSWIECDDNDNESGLNHLYHAAANIAFLIEHQEKGLGIDDRFKYEEESNQDDSIPEGYEAELEAFELYKKRESAKNKHYSRSELMIIVLEKVKADSEFYYFLTLNNALSNYVNSAADNLMTKPKQDVDEHHLIVFEDYREQLMSSLFSWSGSEHCHQSTNSLTYWGRLNADWKSRFIEN